MAPGLLVVGNVFGKMHVFVDIWSTINHFSMSKPIETSRLSLYPATPDLLKAALQGDAVLAKQMNVRVIPEWNYFGDAALEHALEKVEDQSSNIGWWIYFSVLRKGNILIGSGGYEGAPSADGTVEIYYEISDDYQELGLATEMVSGLIRHAFTDERVKAIIAHTLASKNASTSVLEKCGMRQVETLVDPQEGMVWRWSISKESVSV
jgi:ribosomal-protein-alanine N-acetyltransferase